MRISDGSSDVCSSDLRVFGAATAMILLAAVPCVAVAEPRHDLVAGALEKAAIFIVIARAARPWTVAIGRIAARRGIAELARPQRAWAFAAPAARLRSEEHTSELQALMRT